MKVFKRIKWSYVVLSAMFLLLGIYLVVNPETSLVMICRILGAAMAVFGVMKIVLYFIREVEGVAIRFCLLYTSPSPRDVEETRMPSSA